MSIPDFYRGDTKKYKVVLQDKDTEAPISVDGGQLTVSMKKKEKDTEYLLQEVVATTEPIPGVPAGIINITLPAAKTILLPIGTVYYDFEYINAASEVTTLLSGSVSILYDITIPVA